MTHQQMPLVRLIPPMRDVTMTPDELAALEDQVLVDVAGDIRTRIARLPADSYVVDGLGQWADRLAAAGAARLQEPLELVTAP